MFSRLFKLKEQVILERLLHDNHVQSPCIASFLPVNGVADRHVYIGEKQCRTIRFVLIEVVPDPFITDSLLLNERKQYEGVQLFIPIQFHGLLNRCRKAISSIEEIPDALECSIVLIEDALLLNVGVDAAVYVPSKTQLSVVAIQKDHDNKPVKAVFKDIKGDKYIAKDVTPLVAYILVKTERMTLEQYISRGNHRHSTVVTFDDIDGNDVASNDPMEFKKLKTILAGQVQVKTTETFDFVVAFSNNKTDHTVLLIPKEQLKDIHAKLTNFKTNSGKAEFICSHFQGCSYDEVIASKLYTIDPKDNMICNFSVTVPSHLHNVYVKDPTSATKNRPKTSADTTSIATPKCIDPRKDDAIIEDDYEPLGGHMLEQGSASEIKDAFKKDAKKTYKKQNDDVEVDSDYMLMNGPSKMFPAQTCGNYVNGIVLAFERNQVPFSGNAPTYDDKTSNKVQMNIDAGYVVGRLPSLERTASNDDQGNIDNGYVVGRVPSVERMGEQNDEVFVTGDKTCPFSRRRHSIHGKHGRPYKEHIKSTETNAIDVSYVNKRNIDKK
ncbi:hypothetical protein DPMN_084342 [Dreissena polymorpha]|uniref:Uncharacterized protein n=1 Tax=Dreissena polymorpha TaxID=45954 RepID=A0A9D4BJ60_DREPO|nr:hypothetical protein DPMN_084342 [Dreissena polymorpha]